MELGLLEQSPRQRTIYTQLCFCFSSPNGNNQASVVAKLEDGLKKLTTSFPWVAGQVVNAGKGTNGSDIFKIAPFREIPVLVTRDLTQFDPELSMRALRLANFPFRLLDEREICPRTTLSEGSQETGEHPYPVLMVQVNFVQDGLLLTVQACHSTMDIVGQVQMIQLLSRACNGEDFTMEEIDAANLDRRNLIPLLTDMEDPTATDIESETQPKSINDSTSSDVREEPVHYDWAYFDFDAGNLATLKRSATSTLPKSVSFVSTDDAICAVLWQSIGRARLNRLHSASETTFVRQVEMRQHMNIPQGYSGNMVVSVSTIMTLQELTDAPLGVVAARLRSELEPKKLKNLLQFNATNAAMQYHPSAEVPKDRKQRVVMSSWTKAACYNVDFGLGHSTPECVRRPRFSPTEGVIYLLPKSPDGEIAAGLCLRVDDMEMMESDIELLRYATYIG